MEVVSAHNSDQNYAVPFHEHDVFMFLLLEKGLMKVRDEGGNRSMAIAPRQFIVVPPGRGHSTASLVPEQRHLVLYAHADAVDQAVKDLTDGVSRRSACSEGVWTASSSLVFLNLAKREYAEPSPVDARAQVARLDRLMLLECLAIALSRPGLHRLPTEKHGAALVRQIMTVLENSLETMPTLDEIAARFGISRRHLTRTFAEVTGTSVLDAVQRLRVSKAKTLLRHTRSSVTEVAQSVGFESPSHFAVVFRRATNTTPDLWRRSRPDPG